MEESKDDIKNAMTNAIIAMEGSKYILAALTSDDGGKAIIHQECSFHQTALLIKSMLSQNKMLMMDVLSWCTQQVEQEMNRRKSIINN